MASLSDLVAQADSLDEKIEELLGLIDRTGTSAVSEARLRKLNATRAECQIRIDCVAVAGPEPLTRREAEEVARIRIVELRELLAAAPEDAKRRFAQMPTAIKLTHFKEDCQPFVRCEAALEFQIGSRRGMVSVPFTAEISADKEQCLLFSEHLLESICAQGDEPVIAQHMSKVLGCSRSTVGRWCTKGGLPHRKEGFNLMVLPSDVRSWLAARRSPEPRLSW
jgi:hypothetical protein